MSSVLLAGLASGVGAGPQGQAAEREGLARLEAYQFAALESEVAGIHPHPTQDGLFLVAANGDPAYAAGQTAVLAERYRGKLLVVDRRSGEVSRAIELGGGNYGGMAYGDGVLFVSSLEPPEILKVDLEGGRVVGRIAISGPAGGLEYDAGRGRLLAQLYVGHPHLAVVDVKTGRTVKTLWSDENAMDLARVGGELLCTWVSGFDREAFSELRRIDAATGKVTGRLPLGGVHTSMAALDARVSGVEGFISLVRLEGASGRVGVWKYAYDPSRVAW